MAILLVKIEDVHSLAFNEFFDYCGACYASTRSRESTEEHAIDMADFFDAAVNTETLSAVPVVFVAEEKGTVSILGWYRKAEIYSEIQVLSFFLEGNIRAEAGDCVWLPSEAKTPSLRWAAGAQLYEVIEEEDARFRTLQEFMESYAGENQMLRYHTAPYLTELRVMKDPAALRDACAEWAGLVAAEKCQDIRDLKTLEIYARRLAEIDRGDSDGYYYLALADYHLGFTKDGIKQINKALRLEPEASDLIALKGLLLVSRGYAADGAALLHEAFAKSGYELYHFMEGRAYMMAGKLDLAYDCFKQIKEESLQGEAAVKLKSMERKWGSIKSGYLKIKNILRKKKA